MLPAFLHPVRRGFAAGAAVLAALVILGPLTARDSFGWYFAAIAGMVPLFGWAARGAVPARAADVPARTWLAGLVLAAGALSAGLAALCWAGTLLLWRADPPGARFDSFVITVGERMLTDVSGRPYPAAGSETTALTWAGTYLVFAALFLCAAVSGAALGAVRAAWGAPALAGLLLAVFAAWLGSLWLALSTDLPGIRAPWPGVFLFTIPIGAIAAALLARAVTRIEP